MLLKDAPAAHLADPREVSYTVSRPRPAPKARARTGDRVWAIGGGKGGVGKSLLTANVGITLAQMGHRVCVIDADLGGANLHSCLGVTQPRATLDDFVTRQAMQRFTPKLVINQVRSAADAKVGHQVALAARNYFGFDLQFAGYLQHDDSVWRAVRKRRPFLLEYPVSPLADSLRGIVAKILTP